MTGKSHRVGGMTGCLIGFTILKQKGLLLEDINPLLQFIVMYPFSIYGGILPDMDHGWESVPSKDIVSMGIHKVLHLTSPIRKKAEKSRVLSAKEKKRIRHLIFLFDSKHRSWQTHSDVFMLFLIFLYQTLLSSFTGGMNSVLLSLVFTGLIFGVLSHGILDMLTPDGLHSVPLYWVGKLLHTKDELKLKLVPSWSYFSTTDSNSKWETRVRKILWFISFALVLYLIYSYSPYIISIEL